MQRDVQLLTSFRSFWNETSLQATLTCCGKRRFSTFPQVTLIRFFFRLSLCTCKLPKASETCQFLGLALREGVLDLHRSALQAGTLR